MTNPQSIQALRLANEARCAKAKVKRRIRGSKSRWQALTLVAEALESQNGAGALTVMELLLSVPRVGKYRAGRIVKWAEVPPLKYVRDLTDRQRRALLVELER